MDRIFSMLRPARAVSVMTALVALVMLAGCDNLHQDMGISPRTSRFRRPIFLAMAAPSACRWTIPWRVAHWTTMN